MAVITAGDAGTFKTATAEARAVEVLMLIQSFERDANKNPGGKNFVNGSLNTRTAVYGGTFQLPVTESLFTDGTLRITAAPYLTNSDVVPGGSEPTFKSANAEAHLIEVFSYLQAREKLSAKNPDGRNYVTATYDQDKGLMSGTFSIPCDLSFDPATGVSRFTGKEYLLA
jgi:hypothetical protein